MLSAHTLPHLQRIRNAAEARMRRQRDKVILLEDRLNGVNKALRFQIDQRAFFSFVPHVLKTRPLQNWCSAKTICQCTIASWKTV